MPKAKPVPAPQIPFFFPDVNNGVTIFATDLKEAEKKLAELIGQK